MGFAKILIVLNWEYPCSLYAAVQVQSPPSISVGPSRIYVPIYEQANFLCLVEGNPKPSIAWFKDGVEIPGEKSQFLIIRSATLSDRGNYYCTATNDLGTATSNIGYLGLYGMYTQILMVYYSYEANNN